MLPGGDSNSSGTFLPNGTLHKSIRLLVIGLLRLVLGTRMHENLGKVPAIEPLPAHRAPNEVHPILLVGPVMVVIPHG